MELPTIEQIALEVKDKTFMQSLPDLVECEGFVYTFDDFGKTIFRDKEGAEAALERMEGNE